MALSPFLHNWFHLFLPYQSLSHFRTLLDFFADLILYRSVTAQRKVYLLYSICILFCLQNAYFGFFLPPPIDRLRLGDFITLIIPEDTIYFSPVTLAPMIAYYIHVLCATMKPAFLRLLEDTLFQDTTRTLTGVAYGKFTEQETARIVILGLVNLLHVFILGTDIVILYLFFTLITTAFESPGELFGSPLQTPLTFIWNIICLITCTWNSVTGFALYSKIIINVAALGAAFLCLGFRRLYQSETILAIYRRKDGIFSWTPFCQYLRYSRQNFQLIFTVNHIHSRLFFAFLLVHMPTSAWVIVQIALGKFSQWSSILLTMWAGHELLGCILLHWVVAKFTKRLHAPSKTLLTLNASTGHRMGNFRARLLLHHTIVRLHTKTKYGITYGSVGGLITFGSFGKCMLLYTELLMYAYKLIRGI